MAVAGFLAATVLAAGGAGDTGLVADWHLDEIHQQGDSYVTPDSSGNGLDGYTAGVGLTSGRFGKALLFGTRESSVDVRNPGDVLEPANVTLLAWVKANGSPGPYRYVAAKGARGCAAASYALYTGASGGLSFYADVSPSPVASPDAGSGIWDGNWHAVAGTFDGKHVRLYVDGREVGSAAAAQGTIAYGAADAKDFELGDYPDGVTCDVPAFTGAIDEVQVYDRALSGDEIAQLETASGPEPPQLESATTSSSTSTAAATTTTATTPTTTTSPQQPQGRSPAANVTTAVSRKLTGGIWLSAATSSAFAGRRIVAYDWDTNGDGRFDFHCGPGAKTRAESAISIAFPTAGRKTIRLQVTDTAGQAATTTTTVNVTRSQATHVGFDPVMDCENPAAGNHPDHAGCVKTFAFGIVEVNSRGETGDCFRFAVTVSASIRKSSVPAALDAARTTQAATGSARQSSNRYISYHAEIDGPVAINGLYVPIPESQHSAYDSSDDSIGLGRHETLFGKYRTLPVDLSLKVAPDKFGFFKVADVPLTGAIQAIGGLQAEGTVTLGFVDRKTRVTFHLRLPDIFKVAGGGAEGDATFFMSNEDGLSFDGGKLLATGDVLIGPIDLSGLYFDYSASKNTWAGGAEVKLLPVSDTLSLHAIPPPPDNGFGLKNGRFDHAGIDFVFPELAQPQLFPGVFLRHIGVAIGVNPLRFTGTAGITTAKAVFLDGSVFVAFATPSSTYQFPEQSGDLQGLSGRTLRSFTIAVGGQGYLYVPAIGKVDLADGYVVYEYPSFFEVAGGIKFAYSFFSIEGGIHGFVDGSSGKWDYDGGVKACLKDIRVGPIDLDFLCWSIGAVISSKGIGFCTVVPVPTPFGPVPIDVGVGYTWGEATPDLMLFSCDYGPWKESVPGENGFRLGQSVGSQTFSLPAGLPAATIRVEGVSAAPDVTLSGPGGRTISTASPPRDRNIVVIKLDGAKTTYIALKQPAAGRWTVTPAVGAAVKSVAAAQSLSPATITAHVVGAGRSRELVYRVPRRPGRTVTFAERGAGTYRVLGTAGAAAGRIRFTPAPGPGGRRQIVAQIAQNGSPLQNLVVAGYRAASVSRLLPPKRLSIVRRGATVAVRWRPVAGASRYAVTLALTTGARTMRIVRGTSTRFAVPARLRGTAVVGAIGTDGSLGGLARVSLASPARRKAKPRRP